MKNFSLYAIINKDKQRFVGRFDNINELKTLIYDKKDVILKYRADKFKIVNNNTKSVILDCNGVDKWDLFLDRDWDKKYFKIDKYIMEEIMEEICKINFYKKRKDNIMIKFKKNDECIVAIVPMSNAARRYDMSLENIKNWTYEGIVTTVGRKYITVMTKQGWEVKFNIDDLYEKTNYSPDYKLYENIQEIYNEREAERINDYIRDKIGQYGSARFNLEKLKRIKEIIDEKQ